MILGSVEPEVLLRFWAAKNVMYKCMYEYLCVHIHAYMCV